MAEQTEQIKQIAERIREIREISDISTEALAAKLGITTETYTEYESGNTDIPVGIVFKISELFNIELSVLLGGDNPKLRIFTVVRSGKGLKLERRKQYKYESLAYNFIHKKAEPFMVTVDPKETLMEFHSHPGQEFNYVVSGKMMTVIEGHEIILNEGDSVYFDSGYEHAMKALNNEPVRFLAIIF
ncbi:MAG TPA: XRE family transcriptional regulator [Bacteroidales bacterium]|nr:XRE family transcriptional regulator [Bacteroidales bacterium]HPT22664.1 XRE family transcriptional regulator [Bacteroidales bacterium]